MRIEPELDEVVNGERGMLRAIDVLVEAQCLVSAVALIFSTIDALSALTRPVDAPDTSKRVFLDWTVKYLQPGTLLGCNPQDLYAARCGVLHTYSAESTLGREKLARRLVYEWKSGPSADAVAPLPDNAIVIQVETLHRALHIGVRGFLVDSEMDVPTRERVRHHLKSMLCYKPWSRMEAAGAT